MVQKAKPKTVLAKRPEEQPGQYRRLGGSKSDDWNQVLANQAVQSLWLKNSSEEDKDKQINGVIAALIGTDPKDEIEGMVAAQLIAAHNSAMECYRRAMISDQTFEGRRENLTQANRLSRTQAVLIEALNRHRGKGNQKVTVEHVHVHPGGQAIVGTVQHSPSPLAETTPERQHAVADEPSAPMWSEDPVRKPMPGTGDG
jgi:hypothetical protein